MVIGTVARLAKATVYFGAQEVFRDLSWEIYHDARVGLVGPNGAVALALRSSREGGFVGLQARPDGQARLELSAPPLSSRVDVTLDTAGTAAVTVTTPQGGQGALGAAVDGRVGLGLLDGEAYRAGMGLAPDGGPFIRLFGPEGSESEPLWEAP